MTIFFLNLYVPTISCLARGRNPEFVLITLFCDLNWNSFHFCDESLINFSAFTSYIIKKTFSKYLRLLIVCIVGWFSLLGETWYQSYFIDVGETVHSAGSGQFVYRFVCYLLTLLDAVLLIKKGVICPFARCFYYILFHHNWINS